MGRFTLEVPNHLLEEFDNRIKELYGSRAEAIRAAMRLLIKQINSARELVILEKNIEVMKRDLQ